MCTQAQAADTTTALGIWKCYLPNTELDRPDILGKFYKEFGFYKFTNLVEEAGSVGVGNIAEQVDLYGKMQHSGDIRRPRAKRLEFRRRKAIDYSGFDVNTSSSEDGELIDLKEPKIRLLTFEILLKCMRQLCIACMSL